MIDKAPSLFLFSKSGILESRIAEPVAKATYPFPGSPLSLRSTLCEDEQGSKIGVSKAQISPAAQLTSNSLLSRQSLPPLTRKSSTLSPGVASISSSSATSHLRSEPTTPSSLSSMTSTAPQDEIAATAKDSGIPPHDFAGKMRERAWPEVETSFNPSLDIDMESRRGRDGGPQGDKVDVMSRRIPSPLPSLPRAAHGERLPGIASIDEHMSTSWLAGLAARRREGDTGPRSPFSPSNSVFADRSGAHGGQVNDRLFQRRGTATEPISPRMSSLKRDIAPFENEHKSASLHQRAASPSHRDSIEEKRADRYPASPHFVHPSSSRRATLREDDEYSSRWGRDEQDPLPSLRPYPGDAYRTSPTFGNSLRTRSLGNWKVGGIDESAFRRDSYRSGIPAMIARGSAPSTTSVSYDAPPLSARSSAYDHRMYDAADEHASYYDDESRASSRHHSYAASGGVTPPSQQVADISAHGHNGGSPGSSRRRGKLPKPVTDLLKTWLLEHASHPYPTEDEKKRLCDVTGLTISQVSNWFINARRRILVPTGSGNFGMSANSAASGAPGMIPSHSPAHAQAVSDVRYGAPPTHYASTSVGVRYSPQYYAHEAAGPARPREAQDGYGSAQQQSWQSGPTHGSRYGSDPRVVASQSGPPQYAYDDHRPSQHPRYSNTSP